MPVTSTRDAAGPGGAMPNAASFGRASGAIQSVVHAGESTVVTLASTIPASASASRMPSMMSSVAGHPE